MITVKEVSKSWVLTTRSGWVAVFTRDERDPLDTIHFRLTYRGNPVSQEALSRVEAREEWVRRRKLGFRRWDEPTKDF